MMDDIQTLIEKFSERVKTIIEKAHNLSTNFDTLAFTKSFELFEKLQWLDQCTLGHQFKMEK